MIKVIWQAKTKASKCMQMCTKVCKSFAEFLWLSGNFLDPNAMFFLFSFLCSTKFVLQGTKVCLPFFVVGVVKIPPRTELLLSRMANCSGKLFKKRSNKADLAFAIPNGKPEDNCILTKITLLYCVC
jgi:hypothetical protein